MHHFKKKDYVQQCETFYNDSIHWGEKKKPEWKSFWITVNVTVSQNESALSIELKIVKEHYHKSCDVNLNPLQNKEIMLLSAELLFLA